MHTIENSPLRPIYQVGEVIRSKKVIIKPNRQALIRERECDSRMIAKIRSEIMKDIEMNSFPSKVKQVLSPLLEKVKPFIKFIK